MLKKIAVVGLLLAASSAAQAAKVGFNVAHMSGDAEEKGNSNKEDYKATEYGFSMVTNYDKRSFHYRLGVNFFDGEIGAPGAALNATPVSLDGFTISNVFAFASAPGGKGRNAGGRFWFGPGIYAGDLDGKDVDMDAAYLGFGIAAGVDFPTEGGAFTLEGAYRKLDFVTSYDNAPDPDYDINGFQFRAGLVFGK